MVIEVLFNLAMMVLDALSVFFTGRRRFDFRGTDASEDGGFTLGLERRKNHPYLEIRVKTAIGTGREHYRLTAEEYGRFLNDHAAGAAFAEECRVEQHDDRLFRRRRWSAEQSDAST
ncbi:hypothetical protein [Labedella endophytica]|uniref:Uncharacterized protein n=1 Tax=Labedella endophytica TaxID=1523160 RepID=A0A3S0WWE9_9MICO|nr:hypothetical protein [Labedella endophytica]RUQ99047.1 hypothetical protein ELQ94_12070 [Labedella endophytica]